MEQYINKIINADCLDILKQLPDKCVDLVLTDPPYLIKNTNAGGGAAKMGQYLFGCLTPDRVEKRQNGQRFNDGQKFYTLTAQDQHGVLLEGYIRKLTPIECERLQTMPDNYTAGVSDTQRYKMLGNGWTVDVIAHLLKGLK